MLPTANPDLAVCLTLTRAIGRARTVEEIYANALDALNHGLGVSRSSILLFDPDGVMRFKACRNLSPGYRRAAEGHTPWAPDTPDAEPILVPDVTQEPSLAPLLPVIAAEGIAAMAFIPLLSRGRVIGKFMLYYPVPRALDADEMQLAALIASQVAFAIERTRASEALEQSRRAAQQLAAIVESSGDAIVSKGLDGAILSWNRAAERMFGYSATEAVGQSITLIIPKDRLPEEDLVLSRVRAGQQVEMETVRRRKDGTLLPISLMVSPVKDDEGRIVGASKIARDITARKRDEAERAELHRRLTTLVAASASLLSAPETEPVIAATISLAQRLLVADAYAVWATDPVSRAWRMLSSEGVSAAFAARAIRTPDGAGDEPPLSSTTPIEDVFAHPLLGEQRDAYVREGVRSMLVCPMRLGSGRAGTLVFYYRSPRSFREGDVETGQALANLAAAAITTADLYEELRTQRNAAEAARRQATFLADASAIMSRSLDYEQTLAAVARLAVPEIADWCAVDIVGDDGQLRRLAAAHVDPAKVALARRLYDKYPPDQSVKGGVHHVVRTGAPAMMASIPPELIAAHAVDDEHRRILAELALTSYICVPLASARGTLGAMTFVYAESGRHYSERDLAMAQAVAARATLAIENAFAYRRVNEASRLKDEFLATLSHELRTPLNAILGYAQMLSMGVLSDERRWNALTVLTRNAEALKQIIGDVLDVARINSGKLRLNVRPVELDDIVRSAAATVQPAADAKGVLLQIEVDPRVPRVAGDPDRLQQVVWNILSNGVKFTPRGGHVRVRIAEAQSAVEIVVSDDGQGIDPAFLPHIFERFRQADARFAREHGGLGLGLAIVRELTELHGGTVSAESGGPGAGATFTVRLPVIGAHTAAADAAAPAAVHAAGPVAPYGPDRLAGLRVLAVDNEEDALGLLRLSLESAGATVATAGSSEEALEVLSETTFDVLVADIGMPRIDGLELIRRVRRTLPPPMNAVPAAALTAYARPEDRLAALSSGFQMHLAKPLNPVDLVMAVAALAGR